MDIIKIVTPTKALFLLWIITCVAGGFMMSQTHKEYNEILQYQKDRYVEHHNNFLEESQRTQDSLSLRIVDLDNRLKISLRRVDSLQQVKTRIPKLFVDKTDEELAKIMEENARRR